MTDFLKRGFTRWLRRRRVARHFGRHALLDTIAARGPVQGGHTWVGHDDAVMAEIVKLIVPPANP